MSETCGLCGCATTYVGFTHVECGTVRSCPNYRRPWREPKRSWPVGTVRWAWDQHEAGRLVQYGKRPEPSSWYDIAPPSDIVTNDAAAQKCDEQFMWRVLDVTIEGSLPWARHMFGCGYYMGWRGPFSKRLQQRDPCVPGVTHPTLGWELMP